MFSKILRFSTAAVFAPVVSSVLCKNKRNDVYIWGNGFYQARPDAILQFKNFEPKLIKNLPKNLVKLKFG